MKLARRIALLLGSLAAVILVATAVFDLQEDWAREHEDVAGDHRLLGRVLTGAFEHTWRTDGEAQALTFLEQTNVELKAVHIRWIWLDAQPDDVAPSHPWPRHELVRLTPGDIRQFEYDDTFVTLRVLSPGGRVGAIEISESLLRREDRWWMLVVRTGLATLLMAALFYVAAAAIGRRLVGRPIEALTAMARRISEGNLDARVQLEERNELSRLGEELNAMGEALDVSQRRLEEQIRARNAATESLRHADRLATVGQLAAGVAHELGTPMTVIDGHAREISIVGGVPSEALRSVKVIREQVRGMTRIIQQLLNFARRSAPARRDEPLKQLTDRTLEVLFPLAAKKGVHLAGHVPEALTAHVDASGVQQVITNLVMNGIQATPKGGEVEVTAERVERSAPGDGHSRPWIRLDVIDSGIGLSAEVRPHLFEPFFTTKDVGEGTGLGLSVSYGIVRDHGGFIEAVAREHGGTRFSVFLP
jgi:two-component system, NtrC family, sensor kinase